MDYHPRALTYPPNLLAPDAAPFRGLIFAALLSLPLWSLAIGFAVFVHA